MVFIVDLPEGESAQAPLEYCQDPVHTISAIKPAAAVLKLADEAQASQLQLGEFILGDTDCPSLTGHPDIRY